MHINDLRELDAAAVRISADLVSHVKPADLAKPTPCAAWTVYGLVAHMAAQHHGFAAASTGDGSPGHWKLVSLGDDPAATYRAAADRVLAAFAVEDLAERRFPLPEFSAEATFPAEQALSFHLVDYVVHAWDVARALDLPVSFPPEVVEAALAVARIVPDGEIRLTPGAAFAPIVPNPGSAGLDELVALLGRSPAWPVAAAA
ncbi:TIGR03086 family metal-binding protein [Amycolatopsis sp. NPDC059027]|uniref:TIGR03086 family metal-binding protein n=1 Tax=unclassified Amycolatopsis TaxID=2618356 RepID=UPI00366C312E